MIETSLSSYQTRPAPAPRPAPGAGGDTTDAFERLFREYRAGLLSFLQRRLSSREDAEDALMQTFFKAWRARESFRGEITEKQWLFGIASRIVIDQLRARGRHPVEMLEDLADPEPLELADDRPRDPEALLLERERRAEIRRAVGTLDEDQRRLLQLYYFEDCRYAEISDTLGIPSTSLRGRLRRIRQLMHRQLSARQVQ